MALLEDTVEKSFLSYKIAMLNWNEQLGKYQKICKLEDSMQNRIKQVEGHDLLTELSDKYMDARNALNQSILKANNQKQKWGGDNEK